MNDREYDGGRLPDGGYLPDEDHLPKHGPDSTPGDAAISEFWAPGKPQDFLGRGGGAERSNFGTTCPEVTEQSPRRRVPKSGGGKFREKSNVPLHSERLQQGADSSGLTAHTKRKQTKRMEKSAYRAERTGAMLEKATKKQSQQKPPKNPGVLKSVGRAAKFEIYRQAHGKIHQVEQENVGIEAAHRTELMGEKAVRGTTRFVKKRIRTRPAQRVRKWEKRNVKAKADHAYQKLVQENPALKKNAVSRFVQKQRLKRRYQRQARAAAKKKREGREENGAYHKEDRHRRGEVFRRQS